MRRYEQCPWCGAVASLCLRKAPAFYICLITLIRIDGSEIARTVGEGGHCEGQFYYPLDVRFTPCGQHLVVADRDNKRVQCLALDGSVVCQMPLNCFPYAVAVDAVGNIIASTDTNVMVFSPGGTLVHNRLSGLVVHIAAHSGLSIDPSSGKIVVGGRIALEHQLEDRTAKNRLCCLVCLL